MIHKVWTCEDMFLVLQTFLERIQSVTNKGMLYMCVIMILGNFERKKIRDMNLLPLLKLHFLSI